MRPAATLPGFLLGCWLVAGRAAGHAGSLGGSLESASVPTWLVVMTGGAVVGVSFLFTSFLTDHDLISAIVARRIRLPSSARVGRLVAAASGVVGVVVLIGVIVAGVVGPRSALSNPAILIVWAGWWAGYTMSVYLLADTWPVVNPWRRLARLVPDGNRAYPARIGAWPAVAGLLGLVALEVVSPVGSEPTVLATVIVGYTAVTLAGAAVYGRGPWFDNVDPIAAVFRWYGRLAPIQRTTEGLSVVTPGAGLARGEPVGTDEVAFLVGLLWVTTFDGFVSTPAWAALAGPLVGAGLPPVGLYLAALVAGFGLFLGVYHLAARYARRTAGTYVAATYIERWFGPALVPIAAGYHLAHFLGFFLALIPALVAVLTSPLDPPSSVTLIALPGWFGGLQLLFVVVGHMLAVWVGHVLAFELFTGRLQPIRSQYPFILAMVFYTSASLWVVAQPTRQPPFL